MLQPQQTGARELIHSLNRQRVVASSCAAGSSQQLQLCKHGFEHAAMHAGHPVLLLCLDSLDCRAG